MDSRIKQALDKDRLIDITTKGRKTGASHRIEISFHNIGGKIYISGMPGKRDWYANLVAEPGFTFHLKQSVMTDIPAKAVPVTDLATRQEILSRVTAGWGRQDELDSFVKSSPLVEVQLDLDPVI